MAGDASGDRRDESESTGGPREPPATGSTGEETTGPNGNAADARDRTADGDRIPLDLSGSGPDEDGEDEDDSYAPEPSSTPIERGDPTLENAVFVVLGALAMILVIARMVAIPL